MKPHACVLFGRDEEGRPVLCDMEGPPGPCESGGEARMRVRGDVDKATRSAEPKGPRAPRRRRDLGEIANVLVTRTEHGGGEQVAVSPGLAVVTVSQRIRS